MTQHTRITLKLSGAAFDFIEHERCHGSTADCIEALLCERAALLHDLLQLNATGEQLGIERARLDVIYIPPDVARYRRWFDSDEDQVFRIYTHLRGFPDRNLAVEQLIEHLKHLRQVAEDQRFKCAQAILNRRIASAS